MGLVVARNKVNAEAHMQIDLAYTPGSELRLEVNASQTIRPTRLSVHLTWEYGPWSYCTVIVRGNLYRKDGTVGERWAERTFEGRLYEDNDMPPWLVELLKSEVAKKLG